VTAETLSPDGANGWFITSPVTVAWDAVDPTPSSGGVTDPPDVTAALEGTNDYDSDPVSDAAGNTATGTASVSIDTVDPTATILTPTDGALLGDQLVDISTNCADASPGSGISSCVLTIDGAPAADGQVTLADGSHTLEVTATDEAGRTATTSITFEIDSTAPVVTAEPLTPDGDNGWFITSPVTIAWDAVDPTPSSGGVTDPPNTTAALEGTNDYESAPVTDAAGNTATGTVSVSIDTVDPVATVASPADGAVLTDSLVDISTNCSDASSGIASCVLTLDGNPITDGQVTLADGPYTLTVTATDEAGRTATTTITFEVDANTVGDPLAIVGFGVEAAALVGDFVDLDATFTGDQAPHSVTIDWGDGTMCTAPGDPDCSLIEPTALAEGEVTASHAYSSADAYTVTMTITSNTGEVATETATVYACDIVGTSGDDWLFGTNGRDIICGLDGDDVIKGLRGNDVLVGGPGNDWIDGNSGHDIIFGGSGNDTLNGHFGNDALHGGSGDDVIRGSFGRDDMSGGRGDDYLYGGYGNDWISGNRGDDHIWGQSGSDTLRGGRGEDHLDGSSGNDTLIGGADDDVLDGGTGWDLLKGKDGNDELYGGPQSDELRGGSGTDTCDPGTGFWDVLFSCEL
ncbi:MAG: Ig-like domain-containing protein, partial [Actinomycetota bacterium]